MGIAFLVSVILKGMGAVLELFLQIILTRSIGVSGYGTYSVWISSSELIYWCLFSALAKCNTYYLAERSATIQKFKKQYYFFYVIPTLLLISFGAVLFRKLYVSVICLIAFTQLLVQDQSSTLMARNFPIRALFGEYVLGRIILLSGVIMLLETRHMRLCLVIGIYIAQYVLIYVFFVLQRKKVNKAEHEVRVAISRWGSYQRADFVQAMIGQVPIILQYIMSGNFDAGVVSVILLVKKLVNFISGPTAKIFLPEFSRLYKKKDMRGIQKNFESIMRIQMMFIAPLSVLLIGYPKVILKILANDLTSYSEIFVLCAAVFLIAASLGPCGGLMQMTDNEKMDNHLREVAVVAMIVVFLLSHKYTYFVLLGLCTQTGIESISKYIFVSRWMHEAPVPIRKYLIWWLLPITAIAFTYAFHLQTNWKSMIVIAAIVLVIRGYDELFRQGMFYDIRKIIEKKQLK